VRQGHYASERGIDAIDPPPDLSIERIGDLGMRSAELASFEAQQGEYGMDVRESTIKYEG
jgi:hypothetical protein